MVYALLADGEEVVIGDKLTSNGDGALKVYEADASDAYLWCYYCRSC